MDDSIATTAYSPKWESELISLWRDSFELGVGVSDPHTLEEQAIYFKTMVLPTNSVRIATSGGRLMGFVAASPSSVSQLYVHVRYLRTGIGSRLLSWAKANSRGDLWLYTFARNHVAQRFYESQGFAAVSHGFEPTWQLEDVKYRWVAQGRT